MTDGDNRTFGLLEDASDVRRVDRQTPKRNGGGLHGNALRLQPLDDAAPARRVRERAVHENDRRRAVRAHCTTSTNGFPFSTTYVASSLAFPSPTFLTAWTAPAGTKKTSPASTVVGALPSTSYSSEPSRT